MINLLFGIHNHQPVGNFDGVMHQVYKDGYLPFINVLEKYPKVRISFHCTGPLFEWIEKNHPEYFDKLRKLSDRNQIEFMGGGFYEPLLPIIPQRDALGQIQMMQDYIKSKFGKTPQGMWLAERVWEPGVPSIIAKAGLKYVTIDDTHFYYAGFKTKDMFGYYITEDQGNSTAVFPIDKELRYRIPFRMPEETIEYLRKVPEGEAVTIADDGEKFGVWPGTHKWVYTDGYLDKLFTLLTENSEWIKMVTFSEYMKDNSAKGKVYLPTASYDEMMEWALPVDSQAAFSGIVEGLKKDNKYEWMRPYVRGGFWRNFLVKYPESNQMYSKMIHVSNKINELKKSGKDSQIKKALRELYKGQCNCSYWHGLFGGLYLNYLRHAVYDHLIAAENILELNSYSEEKDYDFDGHPEILISNHDINLYLAPVCGGQIAELDYKPKQFNLSNVLTRRLEAYHSKIHAGQKLNSGNQPQSIHDIVNVKEAGLENILFYDWYKRNSLIDHLLSENTTLKSFSECKYGECGDFVNQPYDVVSNSKTDVVLERDGNLRVDNKTYPLRIRKSIKTGKAIKVEYELNNTGKSAISLWFGVEFNLTLLAGNNKDRYYAIPEKNIKSQPMNTRGEDNDIKELEITDAYNKFKVQFDWTKADLLWRFPIETVSHSEGGLERTYQGSSIMPSWKLQILSGEKKNIKIAININTNI